ncbi:MAG TPA: PVC-type heme-binding CxxCH protein [Verrucomicrobiae bacterium]
MKPSAVWTAILFFAAIGASPAAEFKFGAKTIRVPDGYELELIARTPLVDRPVSISFDEQGRLYATDSSGSNEKGPTQYERKDHRVVRLEDTDADGKFDKTMVFADKLTFPEGCLWHEGSLYIAGPPEIVRLTDADGDGVAEKREVWHDGKTVTGCANDLHGPYLGRDGWIYFTKGAFAEQKWTVNGKPFTTRAGHIFRTRPDHSGLEPVMTGGMDNPVGVTFLSTGERILSCTFFHFPAGGKRDGLIHAIYGGVYGKAHDSIFEHKMTGDVMPVLVHEGAAAPCGITTGSGALFGGGQRDNLFACYFNLHKVVRHELIPDGATFKTKDTDLVASDDPDFHPTDVLEDADGSLIIVDTGGWYKICCPTSQLAKPDVLGAIYRLRKVGAPKLADPRRLKIAWAKQSPADLAKLLDDPRHFVQQRAIAEAGKRGSATVSALTKVIKGKVSASAKQNAVWALARIEGKAAREAVRTALNDADRSVSHAAIHVASLWRDAGAAGRLQTFLGGDDVALARAAAEALGRIGDPKAVPALLTVAAQLPKSPPGDARRILEHSLIYALIELGNADAVRAELNRILPASRRELVTRNVAAVDDSVASLWRAALVALDQIDAAALTPAEVAALRYSGHESLRETALWIAGHRPEVGDRLARDFYGDLFFNSLPRPDPVTTPVQLAKLAKSPAIQETLASIARDNKVPRDSRLIALRAMASSGLKETPARWFDAIEEVFRNDNGELARQAVATARTLTLPKKGAERFLTALQDGGRDPAWPVDVRLDALAASGSLGTVESELFDFLVANVASSKPTLVRNAAASVLAKARISAKQQLALAETMKGVSPLELPRLLPAFERNANEELGLKLVASLKDSSGLRGLRVDLLKPLLAKYPKPVQEAGESLLITLNADAAKQAGHLGQLAAQLPAGDIRRGQAIFLSQKAACSTCHAIGYGGGHLGPDLTNIGKVRTERDLLEAIVYPSASFVRSYEPFTVVTKSGEDFTGIIKKDAPDEIILATGPETEQRVARADITEVRPGSVSIMPQGLEDVLTKQELGDLVTFLKNAQR